MAGPRKYLSLAHETGAQDGPGVNLEAVKRDLENRQWKAASAERARTEKALNSAEQRFRFDLAQKGLRATKRGWPDFFVIDPKTGGIAVVEVKHGTDEPVTNHQRFVLSALAAFGVPTYVWTPERGLRQVKPKQGVRAGPLKEHCPPWDDDHKKSAKD